MEHDLWQTGPSFLKNQQQFTLVKGVQTDIENTDVMAEMKATSSNIATMDSKIQDDRHPLEEALQKTSHWYKIIRIAAYINRFINLYVRKI